MKKMQRGKILHRNNGRRFGIAIFDVSIEMMSFQATFRKKWILVQWQCTGLPLRTSWFDPGKVFKVYQKMVPKLSLYGILMHFLNEMLHDEEIVFAYCFIFRKEWYRYCYLQLTISICVHIYQGGSWIIFSNYKIHLQSHTKLGETNLTASGQLIKRNSRPLELVFGQFCRNV